MEKRRIIEKAYPLIVASINKYAIGKGEFEDLYQEGVVKILELLGDFDKDKGVNIFYYLKLHLRYFYLNYGRYEKQTISLNIPTCDGIELGDLIIDENINIEETIIKEMALEDLHKALDKLSESDRYIIKELYLKGRTLDLLSKELDISRTSLFRKKEKVLKTMKYSLLENPHSHSYLYKRRR